MEQKVETNNPSSKKNSSKKIKQIKKNTSNKTSIKKNNSKIIIISGNSGAGKTTIANILLNKHANLKKVITCTTRQPRSNEVNGKDYFFLTQQDFEKNIELGLMAEFEKYSNNYYGSRKNDVEKLLNDNYNVLFVVDTKGAITLKKVFPRAMLFFVEAPSIKELEQRLRLRGEPNEVIQKRLNEINDENTRKNLFDFIIINNDLNNAVKEFEQIIFSPTLTK